VRFNACATKGSDKASHSVTSDCLKHIDLPTRLSGSTSEDTPV
jgi:hypothetical protein